MGVNIYLNIRIITNLKVGNYSMNISIGFRPRIDIFSLFLVISDNNNNDNNINDA